MSCNGKYWKASRPQKHVPLCQAR